MNLAEFKAWFEGFTESMDGPPGLKAWERIQARVAEIKSEPTPLHRIVHEYPWYDPYWYHRRYSSMGNSISQYQGLSAQNTQMTQQYMQGQALSAQASLQQGLPAVSFNDIGRQEAENLACQ